MSEALESVHHAPKALHEEGPVRPAADRQRQDELAQQTREEHDALLVAMHQLEAALAAAAPGREQPWNRRVLEHLRTVQQELQDHVVSAEGPAGLFAAIDLCRPTLVRRVEHLRGEHARLGEQSATLLTLVEDQGRDETPDFADVRRQAMSLFNALRYHQAAEADLIFESFFTDIGAGD